MQTSLAPFIKDTPDGIAADAILRKCVHCGFCNATCPTYQLLGDELDGPRGRIYLIKQILEGSSPSEKTQLHLDRCLTCRACETTCPSGVRYGALVDIGRKLTEKSVTRGAFANAWRSVVSSILLSPIVFGMLLTLGRLVRPVLPSSLRRRIPGPVAPAGSSPSTTHSRRMLVLEGCVQPALSPSTNAATARVLDRLGITLLPAAGAGCCGAVKFHLNEQDTALGQARRNIDAWWPHVEAGAEAIVITASGCGLMVKEYGHHLADDPAYAAKAKRVSELAKDISEVISAQGEKLKALVTRRPSAVTGHRVAFHPPCTLQHGMKLKGGVEKLLTNLGYSLTDVPDTHLCCGSAGTYSIFQPDLSRQLQENKVAALESGKPTAILTANVGCQLHLQAATDLPVRHWIEALDDITSH
jgi:glycolate oxidase iron-sulfur subunit